MEAQNYLPVVVEEDEDSTYCRKCRNSTRAGELFCHDCKSRYTILNRLWILCDGGFESTLRFKDVPDHDEKDQSLYPEFLMQHGSFLRYLRNYFREHGNDVPKLRSGLDYLVKFLTMQAERNIMDIDLDYSRCEPLSNVYERIFRSARSELGDVESVHEGSDDYLSFLRDYGRSMYRVRGSKITKFDPVHELTRTLTRMLNEYERDVVKNLTSSFVELVDRKNNSKSFQSRFFTYREIDDGTRIRQLRCQMSLVEDRLKKIKKNADMYKDLFPDVCTYIK